MTTEEDRPTIWLADSGFVCGVDPEIIPPNIIGAKYLYPSDLRCYIFERASKLAYKIAAEKPSKIVCRKTDKIAFEIAKFVKCKVGDVEIRHEIASDDHIDAIIYIPWICPRKELISEICDIARFAAHNGAVVILVQDENSYDELQPEIYDAALFEIRASQTTFIASIETLSFIHRNPNRKKHEEVPAVETVSLRQLLSFARSQED